VLLLLLVLVLVLVLTEGVPRHRLQVHMRQLAPQRTPGARRQAAQRHGRGGCSGWVCSRCQAAGDSPVSQA
jgi:hypothetical protein